MVRFFLTGGPGTFDAEWRRWLASGSRTALVLHLLVAVLSLCGMLVAGILAAVILVQVLPPIVVLPAAGLYFLRRMA